MLTLYDSNLLEFSTRASRSISLKVVLVLVLVLVLVVVVTFCKNLKESLTNQHRWRTYCTTVHKFIVKVFIKLVKTIKT